MSLYLSHLFPIVSSFALHRCVVVMERGPRGGVIGCARAVFLPNYKGELLFVGDADLFTTIYLCFFSRCVWFSLSTRQTSKTKKLILI